MNRHVDAYEQDKSREKSVWLPLTWIQWLILEVKGTELGERKGRAYPSSGSA
jgi:hypothetical protein